MIGKIDYLDLIEMSDITEALENFRHVFFFPLYSVLWFAQGKQDVKRCFGGRRAQLLCLMVTESEERRHERDADKSKRL